jgi:hemerythrin-like metal-binding protein
MVEWSDELLTGIHEIDQQHKVLFDCLAQLQRTITDDEMWSTMHFVLTELSDYARIHFAVEEALMRLHDYRDLEAHCTDHRNFVAALREFNEKSIRMDISGEMVQFLTDWLTSHIAQVDRAYVEHLRTAPLAPAGKG